MLREILSTDIFRFLLVFARLGAAVMFFPGLGSALVNTRTRLLLALTIAFLLLPVIAGRLPAMPPDPLSLFLVIGGEVTVGIFLGLVTQLLMAALDLAGNSIGYSIGLTNAFVVDAVTAQQSQLVTGFLNMAAVTILLATNMHHLMLRAVVDSYAVFTPGQMLPFDDFSSNLVHTLGDSFVVGFQLAAPAVVFALVFNTGLGLVNRLVPQVQVFFVGLPIQVLVGLMVLSWSLPAVLLWFLRHFQEGLGAFAGPG